MLVEFVCCGWNCEQWFDKCIDSVLMQNDANWKMHVVIDASPDNTYEKTLEYIKNLSEEIQQKFNIINRDERMSALYNIDDIVSNYCQEDSIVAILDFDDWLAHQNVVSLLKEYYTNSDVWIAWSRFIDYPSGNTGFSRPMREGSNLRDRNNWFCGPLRTFRKKLYDKINKDDLLNEDGEMYRAAYDVAILLPMLEMAGSKHRKFMNNVMYIYNKDTGFNGGTMHYDFCIQTQNILFNKTPYTQIESLS